MHCFFILYKAALIQGCLHGSIKSVKYLLNNFLVDQDLNYEDKKGYFPLLAACKIPRLDGKFGIPNTSTNDIYIYKKEIIKIFLDIKGIDINKRVFLLLRINLVNIH